MSRVDVRCARCGKPDIAYVCFDCSAPTRLLLAEAAGYVSEVQTTVARLARHAERGGRRPGPDEPVEWVSGGALRVTPLPVDLGASADYENAAADLAGYARLLVRERGLRLPGWDGYQYAGPVCGVLLASPQRLDGPWRIPRLVPGWSGRATVDCRHASCVLIRTRASEHPIARAARLIARHVDWLRHRPSAHGDLAAVHAAAAAICRIVDAPPPLWYAGPCWEETGDGELCEGELYALATSGSVRCLECCATHLVADRRDWLLGEAVDALAHAEMLAAALSALDRPVTSAMIRGYAHRGRIAAHGEDQRERPLYRVGDVLAVLDELEAKRARRADPQAA